MKEINMNETARRTLKTLPDFEQILQEIRLAHLTQDQDKLDALFTEFYDAVMCDSDSCYHILHAFDGADRGSADADKEPISMIRNKGSPNKLTESSLTVTINYDKIFL